jgi:hypothetical protein
VALFLVAEFIPKMDSWGGDNRVSDGGINSIKYGITIAKYDTFCRHKKFVRDII